MYLEPAILAVIMDNPKYAHVLIENIPQKEYFENEIMQDIFISIRRLVREGKSPLLANVLSATPTLKPKHVEYMQTLTAGIVPGREERFIVESLESMKWERNKTRISKEIMREVESSTGNAGRVISLARELEVVGMTREDSEFETANGEYLDWIRAENAGIKFGYPSADIAIDSFNLGELVVIAGRPTTGKTWFMLNALGSLMKSRVGAVGFFSLEMAKAAVIERMRQIFFQKTRHKIKDEMLKNELDDEEFRSFYADLKIYSRIYSVSEIARIVQTEKLEVVIIDFMNILKPEVSGGRYEKTTQIILDLKRLAKEERTLAIPLVQVSRAGGDGSTPVTIDMLRDSGAIEENADFIFGLHRPEINQTDSEYQNIVCVNLLKNKRGRTPRMIINKSPDTGKMYETVAVDDD